MSRGRCTPKFKSVPLPRQSILNSSIIIGCLPNFTFLAGRDAGLKKPKLLHLPRVPVRITLLHFTKCTYIVPIYAQVKVRQFFSAFHAKNPPLFPNLFSHMRWITRNLMAILYRFYLFIYLFIYFFVSWLMSTLNQWLSNRRNIWRHL